MLKKLRELLRASPHVHLRQRPPEKIEELVALIDRFLDDKLGYALEWDDFISWKNSNANIEAIRERIAKTEALFFSKRRADREQAISLLLDERNRAAAYVGMDLRSYEYPAGDGRNVASG